MPSSAQEGLARMTRLTEEFPDQLASGFATGAGSGAQFPDTVRRVVAVGMGGSAIGAEVLESLIESETELFWRTVRTPVLPRWVDASVGVVAVSYSGDTWETLSAFEEAGRRGSPRVALSSGGRLAERADSARVPHLPLPGGLPPRSSLGHIFGGLLGLFDDRFRTSNGTRLTRAISRLARARRALSGPRGPPARLARQIGRRLPWISAEGELAPVGYRWATQIEENAKRLAHSDVFPELLHNAFVAWNAVPRHQVSRYFVLRLEGKTEDPRIGAGVEHFSRVLRRRGVPTAALRFASTDRLERLLTAIQWGDYLSLALASVGEVDPYPVEAIAGLKRAIATRDRGPGSSRAT